MFIEQLRCDYYVSELFQEECILGPTKPTVDSGLCRHRKHNDRYDYGSLHLTEQVLWMRATAPFARGDSRVSVRGGFLRDF